jgi:hypothetical protein
MHIPHRTLKSDNIELMDTLKHRSYFSAILENDRYVVVKNLESFN